MIAVDRRCEYLIGCSKLQTVGVNVLAKSCLNFHLSTELINHLISVSCFMLDLKHTPSFSCFQQQEVDTDHLLLMVSYLLFFYLLDISACGKYFWFLVPFSKFSFRVPSPVRFILNCGVIVKTDQNIVIISSVFCAQERCIVLPSSHPFSVIGSYHRMKELKSPLKI